MSLVKSKLNKIEALIAKALISNFNSNFSHNEIVLINNVLKEYVEMKQEVKNLKTKFKFKNLNSSSEILVYL